MRGNETQGVAWADLKETPVTELHAGDRFYRCAAFEAYGVASDGSAQGFGLHLNGSVYTVNRIDADGTWHASSGDRQLSQIPPEGHRVLKVVSQ